MGKEDNNNKKWSWTKNEGQVLRAESSANKCPYAVKDCTACFRNGICHCMGRQGPPAFFIG